MKKRGTKKSAYVKRAFASIKHLRPRRGPRATVVGAMGWGSGLWCCCIRLRHRRSVMPRTGGCDMNSASSGLGGGRWLGEKSVADSSHGQKMLRLRRVLLNIFTQAHDEVIDGAGVGVFVQAPDILENRLARHDAAVVADEMPKQLRFHQRQAKDLAVRSQFQRAEVDLLVVERVNIELAQSIAVSGFGYTRVGRRVGEQGAAPIVTT